MQRKYYAIVYDGCDSKIIRVSGQGEGCMSYVKAKKELIAFFTNQIGGYKATLSYYYQSRAKLKYKKGF